MKRRIQQYFLAGLLVWLPMGITVWVLMWLVGLLDGIFLTVLGGANAVLPGLALLTEKLRQVSDTLFSGSGHAFSKALLVQYPRQGSWTIAFLTGKPGGEVMQHLQGEFVSVYVPTTPNPTSGFFLMMPRADVVVLKMSVDEALKYVISMGVVSPPPPAVAAPALPLTPPPLP